jgi:hypothetical protein
LAALIFVFGAALAATEREVTIIATFAAVALIVWLIGLVARYVLAAIARAAEQFHIASARQNRILVTKISERDDVD